MCAVGAVVYLAAVSLKINRFVVPVPPLGHWWTIPILVLGAIQAGALEEVVVAAYLIRRLRQLRWSGLAAVLASATLRGSYHLYQGWEASRGTSCWGSRSARTSSDGAGRGRSIWISCRILRISARVASVTMRGPREISPYSALLEME